MPHHQEDSEPKKGKKKSLAENENLPKVATDAKKLNDKNEASNKSTSGKGNATKVTSEVEKLVSENSVNLKSDSETKKRKSDEEDETKAGLVLHGSISGNDQVTPIAFSPRKTSASSDKTSKTTVQVEKRIQGPLYVECSGCQQVFLHPMQLPVYHAVALSQSHNFYKSESIIEGESSQSSFQKSWNVNILTDRLATVPSYRVYGQTSTKIAMGGDLPIFPKARSIYIHSGNIINWNRLKRKPNQSSSEEITEIFGKTLGAFLEREDKTQLQYVKDIYKVNSENISKIDENEREELKITVKLFVYMPQPTSVISDVVNQVLHELGTNYVETLLLAVCSTSEANEDSVTPTSDMIQPYWEAMEELVSAEKVISLGICDLTKDALEDLYKWAKVKPALNQVNQQSCCLMSHELTEYAKSVNIQILTHNDRTVLISDEELQGAIHSVSTEPDSIDWKPQWVVRYSGIIKSRSIIKTKAYIMHARRGNKTINI